MTTIDEQLERDEELVWVGKANSDRLLRKSDYVWVWSGIVLGTVGMAALIAAVLALADGNPTGGLLGLLIAAVLGALALYFVFGRLARRYAQTNRAAYGITTSRVIVMQSPTSIGAGPTIEQLTITPDLQSSLATHYEGRGTISIGDLTFANVDDAAVVFELLQAQIALSARRGQSQA